MPSYLSSHHSSTLDPYPEDTMGPGDVEDQLKNTSSDQIENVNTTGTTSFTPEEEKALVRKIDLTLLPTVWVMYLLSYLDRTK